MSDPLANSARLVGKKIAENLLLRDRVLELEDAVRYWSGYDDVDFAIKQAKARGELSRSPHSGGADGG
jgi:hypothetical protein